MFTIAAFKSLIVLIGNCLLGILLPGRTYLHKLGHLASTPRFGLDFYHNQLKVPFLKEGLHCIATLNS